MTAATIRLSLTQLCTVERDQADGAWGDPDVPDWQQHLSSLPCRLWVTIGRETIDGVEAVVSESMRMLVELGTDVTEKDRITSVAERGAAVDDGPLGIRAVLRHDDHLELIVVRLS